MSLSKRIRAMRQLAPGAASGKDIEDLHQMRVAVRELRAGLRAYRALIDSSQRKHFDAELRWIAKTLGEVRDKDVFIERLAELEKLCGGIAESGFAHIRDIVVARRETSQATLIAMLESDRFKNVVAEFEAAVTDPGVATFHLNSANDCALPALHTELRRVAREADRAIQKIRKTSPDDVLHATRRRVRRVRYTLEIISAFDSELDPAWRKRAKKVQKILGQHQDAVVFQRQLRNIAEESGEPNVALAAGRAIQIESECAKARREAFLKIRKKLKKKRFENAARTFRADKLAKV